MKTYEKKKQSEFWWLTPEEALKYKYIYVCYQEPYSDEPKSERDPCSVHRFFSVDERGKLSSVLKYYPLNYIKYWREKCLNINVFRSFGLSSSEHGNDKLVGPFIIDIDREEGDFGIGYRQNLSEALEDTRRLVNEYFRRLKEDDFRIFFTGHKGFNIEIRPQAIGIVSISNRLQQYDSIRGDINGRFSGVRDRKFVDSVHCEIRLHNSINRWVANDGETKNRMKYEIIKFELNNLSASEICARSEALATDCLK